MLEPNNGQWVYKQAMAIFNNIKKWNQTEWWWKWWIWLFYFFDVHYSLNLGLFRLYGRYIYYTNSTYGFKNQLLRGWHLHAITRVSNINNEPCQELAWVILLDMIMCSMSDEEFQVPEVLAFTTSPAAPSALETARPSATSVDRWWNFTKISTFQMFPGSSWIHASMSAQKAEVRTDLLPPSKDLRSCLRSNKSQHVRDSSFTGNLSAAFTIYVIPFVFWSLICSWGRILVSWVASEWFRIPRQTRYESPLTLQQSPCMSLQPPLGPDCKAPMMDLGGSASTTFLFPLMNFAQQI